MNFETTIVFGLAMLVLGGVMDADGAAGYDQGLSAREV